MICSPDFATYLVLSFLCVIVCKLASIFEVTPLFAAFTLKQCTGAESFDFHTYATNELISFRDFDNSTAMTFRVKDNIASIFMCPPIVTKDTTDYLL